MRNIKDIRIGEERLSNQGCQMKIVDYINHKNVIVEFQDEHKARVQVLYRNFKSGSVKNPYYPEVYGVGMVGVKYPITINNKTSKEYSAWNNMLKRCFDKKLKDRYETYKDITCCDEWLYYENFYEWLHSQENFNKFMQSNKWSLDKDILIKGNKIYSPETCCLIPQNVNKLFTKRNSCRGYLPIGVTQRKEKYISQCDNPITGQKEHLGMYFSQEKAFQSYKKRKEEIIKQVAEIEYNNNNITKQCYDAMMKYEVEITD